MRTIHVTASRSYDVHIGPGLLSSLGDRLAPLVKGRTAALISESTVAPLYGAPVRSALEEAGFTVESFVFSAGESSKTMAVYGEILNFLSERRLSREDVLVALGGGVTGDMGGFAAATYQRGIPFVQVPTTLLSAVDSSVGGKTAVDLPAGKNLAGAFWQPSLVLCDTDALRTLPKRQIRSGTAEVVKCAVLSSESFFRALEEGTPEETGEDVIARCVACKRDIVAEDEYDTGRRHLLNLGHTVGHAAELCCGFDLLHGEAVAVGLSVIARAAAIRGICSRAAAERILALLDRTGLPTELPNNGLYTRDRILSGMLSDTKRQGATLKLVVPEQIGRCRIEPVPVEELPGWLRDGGVT